MTNFLFALPILTIVMVITFGGTADPVANWLYRWSGLIAGLLAVSAAVLTINQMQRSDDRQEARFLKAEERQEWRHEQLVRLTLRFDRLRAERAHMPQSPDMKKWLRDFEEFEATYAPSLPEPPDPRQCEEIVGLAKFIVELFRRQVLVEALDLYESRLYYVHGRLTNRLENIETSVGLAQVYQSRREPEMEADILREVMVELIAIKQLVAEYAKRLTELYVAYE